MRSSRSRPMPSPRPLASALAIAATMAACSLGIRESEVQHGGTGGSSSGSTNAPGGGGTAATMSATASTATMGPLCGNKVCDEPQEDCSSCPGDCPCFQNTGCKQGTCVDCPATFGVDVDPPDAVATRGLVASNGKLYLAPTLPVGGDTKTALVEVDACFGTVASAAIDPPPGDAAVGGPIALGGAGAEVVAACGFSPSASDEGAALVAGGGDGPFAAWQLRENGSPGKDVLVGIAAAGDVWMASGTRAASPTGWIVYGDLAGKHACASTNVFSTMAEGAAMATDGTNLYTAATDESGIWVATFSASSCDPTSCACAPSGTFGPVVIGGMRNDVGAMLFADGRLYVSGFASDDGSSYYAYVAIVSVGSGILGNVYKGAAASTLDEFVSLAFDGTVLYAAGYEGATAIGDVSAATGVVVGLPPNLDATPMFTVHPKDAHSVVGVATSASFPGTYFAQLDKSPGVTVVHCKSGPFGCQ